MNWLDAFCTAIDIASELNQLIRGTGMNSDLVPLFAVLLFAGGIVFWVVGVFMFFVGVFRLVRRVFWWIGDMHHQMKNPASGGTLPHVE